MLEAAEEAVHFTDGKTFDDFQGNRMLTLSVIKSIEIVGEAASRVSEETQTQLPRVSWADIIGMRNRLIHGYFDMNLRIIWETVQTDLPILITDLHKVLD
jgi:uncharacterized protein with HEPN domain